jgi:hypothetical protein
VDLLEVADLVQLQLKMVEQTKVEVAVLHLVLMLEPEVQVS